MEEERVKEEIARFLQSVDPDKGWVKWDELTSFHQHVFLTRAGAILSIKGIRIESDDQKLPNIPRWVIDTQPYVTAQDDMIEAGFVKCLKKE